LILPTQHDSTNNLLAINIFNDSSWLHVSVYTNGVAESQRTLPCGEIILTLSILSVSNISRVGARCRAHNVSTNMLPGSLCVWP
jgi:hypothetical protein